MNNGGFVTFYYLMVMKLFLIAGVILIISCSLIKTFSKSQNDCRKLSLKAQAILAEAMNTLEKLNPKALALRTEEDIIQAALRLPQLPPVYVALQTKLRINQTQQFLLKAQQNSIISIAELRANQKILSFRNSNRFAYTFPLKLHLIKEPSYRIAPSIYPAPNFERIQSVQLKWHDNAENSKLGWVYRLLEYMDTNKKSFNANSGRLSGACRTTLEKRKKIWQPTLKKAVL